MCLLQFKTAVGYHSVVPSNKGMIFYDFLNWILILLHMNLAVTHRECVEAIEWLENYRSNKGDQGKKDIYSGYVLKNQFYLFF